MAVWHLIRSNKAFFLALGWLMCYAVLKLWPASFWMTVERAVVFDSQEEAPIYMSVDRKIHWPFYGEWHVIVRRVTHDGVEVTCTAHGAGDYRTDAVLPDPLTLDWWTDGKCPTAEAGYYFVTTIWEIDPWLFPPKRIEETSNTYFIAAQESSASPIFHRVPREPEELMRASF